MRKYVKMFAITLAAMLIITAPLWPAESSSPLTLKESIAIARRESMNIRSAREGVSAAESQSWEASTGFLPKFSTSYNYTLLNRDPFAYFPGLPPFFPAGDFITGTRDNYIWAFEVKQPLFAGGAILENYKISKLGVDISGFETSTRTLDTILQVKTAYFTILKAERVLDVARQSVAMLEAHLSNAQGFYDVQMIPRNDVLRAEVELANGRKYELRSANGVEMAKAGFNTILRQSINTPVEVEDIMTALPPVRSLDECIRISLENRPEIKATTLRIRQSQGAVQIARSEYYPTLNALGHFQRFGDNPELAGTIYEDKERWYVSAVASWTFWEWGRTKARVDASQARVNQMDYALTQIKDQIQLEVKNAWLDLKDADEQVRVTFKAIAQAEENFRISQERFKEQAGTATDVLDAQTLLTRAKSDYANALGDYQISYARLERAIGVLPDV